MAEKKNYAESAIEHVPIKEGFLDACIRSSSVTILPGSFPSPEWSSVPGVPLPHIHLQQQDTFTC